MNTNTTSMKNIITPEGTPISYIGDQEYTSLEAVLQDHTDYLTEAHYEELAELIHHYRSGEKRFDYTIITDIDAYKTYFKKRYDEGNHQRPFNPLNPHTSDFGIRELGAFRSPYMDQKTFTYFVNNRILVYPYIVTVEINGHHVGELTFNPYTSM